MSFISHSIEQTHHYAADVAAQLQGGEIIGLEGDLGSGKTTFVQGLAVALGIEGPVRSPTFVLMHVYPIENHPTIHHLVHMDGYRIEKPTDVMHLGLDEWVGRTDVVICIEWPRVMESGGIPFTKRFRFVYQDEGTRTIEEV